MLPLQRDFSDIGTHFRFARFAYRRQKPLAKAADAASTL